MKRISAASPLGILRSSVGYLTGAVLLAPSLVWICRDRSVWPWDPAWYGQVSADLWFWLLNSSRQWFNTMADGLNMKPPGVSWLGQLFVPLRGLFGSVEASLLASILLTQLALLIVLFRIGQRLAPGNRLIPIVAVVWSAAAQLFVGLSHQMFVEPMQAAAVAWTFYIASRSQDWPKARILLHLAAALLLGLLAKATTPMYCVIPFLYSGYSLIRRPGSVDFPAEWRVWPSRVLLVAFALAVLPSALWYARHLGDVWRHVRDASSSEIALDYGKRDTVWNKLVVWLRLLDQSFLAPYLLWGGLAGIVAACGLRFFPRDAKAHLRPRFHFIALLAAAQVALVLLVFALNIAVDSRYMYAVLPGLAILVMQLCLLLPRMAVAVLILFGLVQWGAVNGASLNLAGVLPDQSQWLTPLHSDPTQYREMERVVRLTDAPGKYNIVAIEEPWINSNSASFFAAKRSLDAGPRGYYTSLGYAEKDIEAAMRRIVDFAPLYLITLDEAHQNQAPNFVNLVSAPALDRMRHDPRFIPTPFDSRSGVVVFRFAPLAGSERRGAAAAPASMLVSGQ